MRKLIAFVLLLIPSISWAFDGPKYLEDSTITVTLKSGKEYKFSGNEWMVVRRHLAVCPVSGESGPAPELKVTVHNSYPEYKNRVRLLGGVGPNGFDDKSSSTSLTVGTTDGMLGGVGYDRMLDKHWSVGAQVFTNRTYTLGVGFDF